MARKNTAARKRKTSNSRFRLFRMLLGELPAMDQKPKNDPNARLELLERFSGWATLAILAGIVIDIWMIWWFPHEPYERRWGTLANALIGVGLAAEFVIIGRTIVASGEAKQLADRQVADANARAAEANARAVEAQLELERIKIKIGPRQLDAATLLKELEGKAAPPYPVELLFTKDDDESYRLATQIWQLLGQVWPVQHPMPIPESTQHPIVPTAMAVGGQMSGVSIVENPPPGSDATPGRALQKGLGDCLGLVAWRTSDQLVRGAVRIVVAPKPP